MRRWGIYYQLPKNRQAWAAGPGQGKAWVSVEEADTAEGATMIYRVRTGDGMPVLAAPLGERSAA